MSDTYTPPKVWTWDTESGGTFASTNRPIAGATHEQELPVGEHPFQLYSLATPNGVKVTVLFEELLEAGHTGAEYDAWLIRINGAQFGSGFVDVNPNSKIPALMDRSGDTPVRVFESGAIMLHLAEKFGAFLGAPEDRTEVLSWLMWQMGGLGPMIGQAGHFKLYAPERLEYAVERYHAEMLRLYGVLDKQLRSKDFVTGRYSIADMAIWGWVVPYKNQGQKLEDFPHLKKWFERMGDRPAVKRGFALGLDLRRGTLGDNTKEAAKARKILFNQRAK